MPNVEAVVMKPGQALPGFENRFGEFDQFIHKLVALYQAEEINSWEALEKQAGSFFNHARMEQMNAEVPGWKKMASFANGMTLTHVTCAFLGLYMMPEFSSLMPYQQEIMKWVILLHDLEKEVRNGKRDHFHAFRSAVTAARLLPGLGFAAQPEYSSLIEDWRRCTLSARIRRDESTGEVQDNRRLPEILDGIERLFGHNTPAALIIKTILFHLSVKMKEWPPANPLTDEEARHYFDQDLLPLLKVMHLADSEGWAMFDSTRERLFRDTVEIFEELDRSLAYQSTEKP